MNRLCGRLLVELRIDGGAGFTAVGLGHACAQRDPLPSWNNGPAKQAILKFVKDTTDKHSTSYVEPEDRIATFDQDGTLWTEQPLYGQAMFALDRVGKLAPQHPEWRQQQPFQAVLEGDHAGNRPSSLRQSGCRLSL